MTLYREGQKTELFLKVYNFFIIIINEFHRDASLKQNFRAADNDIGRRSTL